MSAPRLLFRVAAGPRLGFGHLVRCRSLARAAGVVARVSVRGTARTRQRAATLGVTVLSGGVDLLDRERPAVLIVDDPSAPAATTWLRAARRRGVPVASLHDLGLARIASDLPIDGSVGGGRRAGPALAGPHAAVLDPALRRWRERRRRRRGLRVLVALGGGVRARRLVPVLAATLRASHPDVEVSVARGFAAARPSRSAAFRVVSAPDGLGAILAAATVAVVGGGVTAYEACALGVPAVAGAVVPARRRAVRGLARAGAALDGGALATPADARRVGRLAARLLADPTHQDRLRHAARRLVDGRGVWRVAAAIRRLADRRSARGPWCHAGRLAHAD
jgi:spore coat polysaccharide biosynthesis predicted glycosyltransferase SpsG